MQVRLLPAFNNFKERKVQKEVKQGNISAQRDVLSFMSIPSIAFQGKLVIPDMPEGFKAVPPAQIQTGQAKKPFIKEDIKERGFKVYPQDPLITKPQINKMKINVSTGPVSSRVNTIDECGVVKADKNGNYITDIDAPEFNRVNTFYFSNKALKMYEDVLGRKIPWASNSEQIDIHSDAGEMMNAYYNRWGNEIKLFHFQHRFKENETCYTSKMADVITHETGHAILDGMRPSYLGFGMHGGAIHEGFGDSTAMLVAMMDDKLLDKVIEKTDGDLTKENLIASIGEQFGDAVYKKQKYLRTGINNLKMSDFETGKQSKEVHNFGKLLAGAFYDILVDMANEYKQSMPLKDALIHTREDLTRLFARAMGDFSPTVNIHFDDIAKAILKADKIDFDGKYNEMLTNIFFNREVLNPSNIKDWDSGFNNLPDLTIAKENLSSKEAIEKFVSRHKKDLKVPLDNDYKVESAYTNKAGETFIHMNAPRELEMPFADPQTNMMFAIIVNDGLTIAFDKDNKLFYKVIKNLKRRGRLSAIADAKQTIEKMQQAQALGNNIQPLAYRQSTGSNVLVKAPVVQDPVVVD